MGLPSNSDGPTFNFQENKVLTPQTLMLVVKEKPTTLIPAKDAGRNP